MALSADRNTNYKEGVEHALPVGADKKVYGGSLVCLDGTTLLAEPASDAASKVFAGVAQEQVDNSDGDASAKTVKVRRRGMFLFDIAAAAQTDVGSPLFIVDDATVGLAADVDNAIYCGVLAELYSATKVWVDIYPALLQTDVATHIADATAAHAASAISQADAGNHFAAAVDTVEEAIQALAKGPFFLTLPRFTGWTKDGTAKAIALPAIESPVPIMVKRAYVTLGTAPGADKTLALELNGEALVSIAGTDTAGEAEALSIAIAKDTDLALTANETADGAAENCDVVLVLYVDDGEA